MRQALATALADAHALAQGHAQARTVAEQNHMDEEHSVWFEDLGLVLSDHRPIHPGRLIGDPGGVAAGVRTAALGVVF